MDWINIHTSMLRAPEYLGSEPIARATWLNVLGWCCTQENGGRIPNCREWKDRQWQQICGVTPDEIGSSSPLLSWDGNDLAVWGYPLQKQQLIQTNRISGANGGRSKSQAKIQASRANGAKHKPSENLSESQAEPKPEPNGMEGKGKERNKNGIEKKTVGAEGSALSDEEWLKGLQASPACQYIDVLREYSKMQNWCATNNRQPTRKRFVNWLNRVDKPMVTLTAKQDEFGSVRSTEW